MKWFPQIVVITIIRGYPAKRALPAMLTMADRVLLAGYPRIVMWWPVQKILRDPLSIISVINLGWDVERFIYLFLSMCHHMDFKVVMIVIVNLYIYIYNLYVCNTVLWYVMLYICKLHFTVIAVYSLFSPSTAKSYKFQFKLPRHLSLMKVIKMLFY